MITNPYAGAPGAQAWGYGLAYGFASPAYSAGPPPGIAPQIPALPEVIDGFNQGQLAGQQYAIDGLPLVGECMDTAEESSGEAISDLGHIVEAGMVIKDLAKCAWGASISGGLVLFINLSISLETFNKNPGEVLPDLGEKLVELLSELGVGSLEIFCAVGIDNSVAGCQLKFSPLFKSLDQARAAATAMGRPQWLVAEWRTDQCGSLQIAATSEGQ